MSYKRTAEHRARQAEAVKRWKPWEQSSGPQTKQGKVRASQNAHKGGYRPMMRELARDLRKQASELALVALTFSESANSGGQSERD